MKWCRLLCVLLAFFNLSGCNTNSEVVPIFTGLRFTAQINYYNENYSCFTEVDAHGDMTVRVVSPDVIEGMVLTLTKSGVTAQYKGITYTPKTESMPVGNVAQILYDIFDDASKTAKALSRGNDNCELIGKVKDKKYCFTFSPTGLPLSLEIPDDSFRINFSNVTIIN